MAPRVRTEELIAPGAAGGDNRAESATSPPLAASPGRPRPLSPLPASTQSNQGWRVWGGGILTLCCDAPPPFPNLYKPGLQRGWPRCYGK